MERDGPVAIAGRTAGHTGESRAFVLLEAARLRCEALMIRFGRREHLVSIHREIGLAGYVTCEAFSTADRRRCRDLAAARLDEDLTPPGVAPAEAPEIGPTLAKMFSETVSASDALADEFAALEDDHAHRDRLHLVHAHVMSGCELLDERLTMLELQGAGLTPGR